MGMDVNMLACVRALAENRIQDAKKYAVCCCANDNTKKNESQVRRCKNLLLNGPNMIELPANLNGLLRMEDVSSFHAERYYLGKTQWDLFEKIKRGVAVTLKLMEYGIPYKNSTLIYGVPGTGKTEFARYVAYSLGIPYALLIGIALSPDITSDLFMILELLCSVKMGALQYELNKKSRNRMGSCAIYILILPDNTVIVEKPMYENEMQLSGCIFYNPESKKYETYGTVSDKTLAKVRNNEPDLYKKIVNNEPVNAQDYPLSCVWESNIPKEHDELLQYIIEECVYLYSDQLIEFGEYMDKETNIIFQLYGKRNDAVSITLNEYFQHYR